MAHLENHLSILRWTSPFSKIDVNQLLLNVAFPWPKSISDQHSSLSRLVTFSYSYSLFLSLCLTNRHRHNFCLLQMRTQREREREQDHTIAYLDLPKLPMHKRCTFYLLLKAFGRFFKAFMSSKFLLFEHQIALRYNLKRREAIY